METTINTTSVRNPINGEHLYYLKDTGPEEITAVYSRAKKVQNSIAKLSVTDRVNEVLKINDFILKNREMIITRIIEETGKSRFDALSTEVFEICDVIDYFKKASPKILADKKVSTPIVLMGKKSRIVYNPLGVILVIAPWNYPLYQGLVPSLLAFLAGNAVVFKPSEWTPLQGLIEEIIEKSGFMKDAIQVVYGGKETGKLLIDGRPDKIHFTGSAASGRKVMAQAAQYLIPVDLELGGKDPAIVFDDVNIEKTANGVLWGAMTNCGQSCTSIERAYIHEKIYDQMVKRLVEIGSKLKASEPGRNYKEPADCDVGCMTTPFQVDIVDQHIEAAVAAGAKILLGGKREPGSMHFPPTILTDCTDDMDIVKEETFGPVLPLLKFKDENDVIKRANDSPYGLSASVWSKDLDRAYRVARQLEVGNVSINNHMLTEGNPALPFGGVKESGFGRYKGDEGLLTFCNSKSIIHTKNDSVIEPHWYPQTRTKYTMMTQLMDAFFGKRNWIKFAKIGLKLDKVGTKEKL